jgi:hypothetical protein
MAQVHGVAESQQAMSVYVLRGPKVPDWGDYSKVLVSGMTARLDRQDGMLQLERTGPFVPPISLPGLGDVVVTNGLKQRLERSGLSGLGLLPVIKKRIVLLEWEKWDQMAAEPQEYPESGEPEDYILERLHSDEVAQQLGEMWEIKLEEHAQFMPGQGLADWDGTDWFRAAGQLTVYVSEEARKWLEKEVPRWVDFKEVPAV